MSGRPNDRDRGTVGRRRALLGGAVALGGLALAPGKILIAAAEARVTLPPETGS